MRQFIASVRASPSRPKRLFSRPKLTRPDPPPVSASDIHGYPQGYDISFLITHVHCEDMYKHKLVDFIISFMEARGKSFFVMCVFSQWSAEAVCLAFAGTRRVLSVPLLRPLWCAGSRSDAWEIGGGGYVLKRTLPTQHTSIGF